MKILVLNKFYKPKDSFKFYLNKPYQTLSYRAERAPLFLD